MKHVIVIGAGVIGASIAFRLAAAGLSVTVLERDRIGAGTSGTSFTWVNANEKLPRSYHEINVMGMKAHDDLEAEFGGRPWYNGGGSVEWRTDPAEARELRERVDRLKGWGYPADWISAARLRELEPAMSKTSVETDEIAYFPTEGWVDAVTLAGEFVARARANGALVQKANMTGVLFDGDAVTGVTVADGEGIAADLVVNCSGQWASDVHGHDRLSFPLSPTIGLMVTTGPTASGVRRIVRTSGIQFRPDGGGRLMLQSEHDEARFKMDSDLAETYPTAKRMIARAAFLYPDIGEPEPEGLRLGMRAIPGDGLSAIGPVPGITGYYAAVTHSGVTLAPWLGKVVAQEVVTGERVDMLEEFRPARFFAS